MRWSTMLQRAATKANNSYMAQHHVYASLYNSQTGKWERIYLTLKTDKLGRPYFIEDEKAQASYVKNTEKIYNH